MTKHMVGRRGCAQRANRPYAVEAGSRRDGRRPPQAVSDQQCRHADRALHPVHRRHNVRHAGRKATAPEVAFALAQTGEIKAQRGDALLSQRPADAGRGEFFPQVKQWANTARACNGAWSGRSKTPTSRPWLLPAKPTFSLLMLSPVPGR